MKKLMLFLISLLGLVGCNGYQNSYIKDITVIETTSSSSKPTTSSTTSSSSQVNSLSEQEGGIKEYKTDALRIMNDTVKAVWKDNIPENPYTEPDEDGVIYTNYAVDWGEAIDPEDKAYLGTSLLEFQRIENFPEYLFILQPPTNYRLADNSEIVAMFMVTSNCLHVLCVYDYYENNKINIKFEAGPYDAFI